MTKEAFIKTRVDYLNARKEAGSISRTTLRHIRSKFDKAIPTPLQNINQARSVYEMARTSFYATSQEVIDEQVILNALDRQRRNGLMKVIGEHKKLRTAVGLALTGGVLITAATGLLPVTGALLVARGGLQAYGIAGGIKLIEEKLERHLPAHPVNPTNNQRIDNKIRQDRNASLKRGLIAVGIAGLTGSLSLAHNLKGGEMYKFAGKDKLFGNKSSLTGFAEGQYAQKITGHILHPFNYASEHNFELHLSKLYGEHWKTSSIYKNVIRNYVTRLQTMNGIQGDLISHAKPLIVA